MEFDKSTAEILATIVAAIVMAFVILRRRKKTQEDRARFKTVTNAKSQ